MNTKLMLVCFEGGGTGVFNHALMSYHLQSLGLRTMSELIELLFDKPNTSRIWGTVETVERGNVESIWLFVPEDFINGWCDLPDRSKITEAQPCV